MARLAPPLAALGLALAGCTAAPPPQELSGLWSAGPAACAAGVGVRFRQRAIEAVYAGETETLFARPRYHVEAGGERFRVRVVYDLPRAPGGVRVVGARGILVLVRQSDGSIAAERHTMIDGRTGAARMRIVDDPAAVLLALVPCGPHPWREELRGRAEI